MKFATTKSGETILLLGYDKTPDAKIRAMIDNHPLLTTKVIICGQMKTGIMRWGEIKEDSLIELKGEP